MAKRWNNDLNFNVWVFWNPRSLDILHSSSCVHLPQGNKGGVSVRFSFYGHMVCFLNCHLAAHMNYALQRVDELEYILDAQDFDILDTPHIRDHKSVESHTLS